MISYPNYVVIISIKNERKIPIKTTCVMGFSKPRVLFFMAHVDSSSPFSLAVKAIMESSLIIWQVRVPFIL